MIKTKRKLYTCLLYRNNKISRYVGILILMFVSLQAFGQEIAVTGTVTDFSTGDPLPGVNIVDKTSGNGVTSDIDGKYQIQVSGTTELSFSFIGYLTEIISVENRNVIDVQLSPDITSLEEVVVVAYGTQKKATITGAVSNVRGEELAGQNTNSVSNALVGKMAGVMTRNGDGRPGNGTAFLIRNFGRSPLIVIDGVPQESFVSDQMANDRSLFNALDVNDIESISVLKDASASIYGFKGANGVVLVTTKSGNIDGRTRINVNAYTGFSQPTRLPEVADAKLFVQARTQRAQNQGISYPYSEEEYKLWMSGAPGYEGTDWSDIIFDKWAPFRYFNIGADGGNKKMKYHFAYSNIRQEANLKDWYYGRHNITSNVEGKVNDRLTVGVKVLGTLETRKTIGVPGIDDFLYPYFDRVAIYPTETPYVYDKDGNQYIHAIERYAFWENTNPVTYTRDQIGYADDFYKSINTLLHFNYETPIKGLKVSGRTSYEYGINNYDGFEHAIVQYEKNTDGEIVPSETRSKPGQFRRKSIEYQILKFYQAQISYNNDFGKHTLNSTVAFEKQDRQWFYHRIGGDPDQDYIRLIDMEKITDFADEEYNEARAGFIGKINYDYSDKYLLEMAARYDASYLFPEGHRWGFFPYASLGWRVSEESFIKDNLFILTNLKLRTSYGVTGDDFPDYLGIVPFNYLAGYDYQDYVTYLNRGQAYQNVTLADEPITNVTWLRVKTFNVGLDFSLWQDKLYGTVEYFNRIRDGFGYVKDDIQIPDEVGIELPPENLNKDMQYGFEFELGTVNSIGKLNYTVSGIFSFGRSKWLKIYNVENTYNNSWEKYLYDLEGRYVPNGYYYEAGSWNLYEEMQLGYKVIGQFQSQKEIDSYPVDIDGKGNSTLLPGDYIYEDLDGDGQITSYDQRRLGYGHTNVWTLESVNNLAKTPLINFSLNTTFRYSGFELLMDWTGATAYTWEQQVEIREPLFADGNSFKFMLDDVWHRADPFDDGSEWIPGKYPSIRSSGSTWASNNRLSDQWVHNIHYIRLRNLNFGYNLPSKWISKVNLYGAKVYVNITNLFSIDNMKEFGLDPEVNARNSFQPPVNRSYTFGINLKL